MKTIDLLKPVDRSPLDESSDPAELCDRITDLEAENLLLRSLLSQSDLPETIDAHRLLTEGLDSLQQIQVATKLFSCNMNQILESTSIDS